MLHPNLTFTDELEDEKGELPFLDMALTHTKDGSVETSWYIKPTDTGLCLNYNALAPYKYKKSVVIGFVHRIYNATSTWKNFHNGMTKAKNILRRNQYPETIFEKIIHSTLEKIITRTSKDPPDDDDNKKMIFIEYRGKITDEYITKLKLTSAPLTPIITLRKIRSALPTLKMKTDRSITSNIIYKFTCSHCKNMSYVGLTERHFKTRIAEHKAKGTKHTSVRAHTQECYSGEPQTEDFEILRKVQNPNIVYLLIMEALYIREHQPALNTKDEFKERQLRIKV